jgi:hypothetical protein
VALLHAASITIADTAGSVRPARRLYCIVEVSRSLKVLCCGCWLISRNPESASLPFLHHP